MRTFDLSKLSDAELLMLVDALMSTEELRQLAAWAHVYNAWQIQQAGHRRVLYPQLPMHRYLEANYANQN